MELYSPSHRAPGIALALSLSFPFFFSPSQKYGRIQALCQKEILLMRQKSILQIKTSPGIKFNIKKKKKHSELSVRIEVCGELQHSAAAV